MSSKKLARKSTTDTKSKPIETHRGGCEWEYDLLSEIADSIEGRDRTQLLAHLKWRPNTLTYRIGKLSASHYILYLEGTRPKHYNITHKGKQRLAVLRDSMLLGDIDCVEGNNRYVVLQQYRVKYAVISKASSKPYAEKEHEMQNWNQGITHWERCTVIFNGDSSIEIRVKGLLGLCEHQLENHARDLANKIVSGYCARYGMKVSPGVLVGEPEFEVKSEIAVAEINEYGWLPGVRDKSVFKGEFVFCTADEVTSFKLVPRTLDRLSRDMLDAKGAMAIILRLLGLLYQSHIQSDDNKGVFN